MQVDPAALHPRDIYPWLIGAVGPRPIAWVSTVSSAGAVNLAPFSFFNAFGANPPCVAFSPTNRRDGTAKDTLLNVREVPEFVVNIADEATAARMNATSAELPRGASEFEHAGLTPVPSSVVRPPGVGEAPARLECRLVQVVQVGTGPLAANLIIGQVVMFHFADHVLTDGRPDPRKMKQLGRLGGDWYCRAAGDLFEMAKPPMRGG